MPKISDYDLAAEAIDAWDANDVGGDDGVPPQHFDREELIKAFASIRANFEFPGTRAAKNL